MNLKKKDKLSPIGEFIFAHSTAGNYVDAAAEIGISASYFSDIVNGNRSPSIEVCGKIANTFSTSKLEIFKIMGWLNTKDVEIEEKYKDLIINDPLFPRWIKLYEALASEEERLQAIRIVGALIE